MKRQRSFPAEIAFLGMLLAQLLVMILTGALAGCSASKSPDVAGPIRQSLDQSGFKDVFVSQDRDKGVVTLDGHVLAEADKAQAESIAKSIAGGEVVADQVAVVPPGDRDVKAVNSDLDDAIKKNLDAALIQDNNLKKSVDYSVKNGVVTLTGNVRSEARRASVATIASGVPNVQQVVNEIQVKDQKATSTN